MAAKLQLIPMTLREASVFVAANHRHHQPPRGCRAVIGVALGGCVVGVAVIGRPVSRLEQSRADYTAEITRLCTDGTPHAASFLLGRCRRLAHALGYDRLITYTLPEEGGASLRAAGYRCLGTAGGGSWSRVARPRVDIAPTQEKLKWCSGRGAS